MNIEISSEISATVLATEIDLLNVLGSIGVNTGFFGTHFTDIENGVCGIGQLIESILKSNGSVFPDGIEKTSLRGIAIAGAMFRDEIDSCIRAVFAEARLRYPDSSLRVYLTGHKKGFSKFRAIRLNSNEKTSKVRTKYYLAE